MNTQFTKNMLQKCEKIINEKLHPELHDVLLQEQPNKPVLFSPIDIPSPGACTINLFTAVIDGFSENS